MAIMACMLTAVLFLIFGIWLGSDAAECRIYNQLKGKGAAYIKGALFLGGLHEGRVE
ncbi:hypothetical protein [Cupriavidus sp. DL-D2]|uniref:hypothetical protein n=1 Tax=Cupriavidus sp. DL-D2 TaxID=3144974 RepID=UPI00321302EF